MKLLACLLVIAICGYIGRLMSKKTAQRLDFFREYHSSLINLSDRIVGMNLELCKALEASGSGQVRLFFGKCSKTLKRSPRTSFKSIWDENFESFKLTYLSREDVSVVSSGGDAIESLCMNPSEKQAHTYIKRLSGYMDSLEAEKRKKCKLYNTSGMLTGLLIALLMI